MIPFAALHAFPGETGGSAWTTDRYFRPEILACADESPAAWDRGVSSRSAHKNLSIVVPHSKSLSGPLPSAEKLLFESCLASLEREPAQLNPSHAKKVRQVWREMLVAVGPRLPLPRLDAGDEGEVRIAWSTDTAYSSLEVHPDGSLTWFVRDHSLGTFQGSGEPYRGGVPRSFLEFIGEHFSG